MFPRPMDSMTGKCYFSSCYKKGNKLWLVYLEYKTCKKIAMVDAFSS